MPAVDPERLKRQVDRVVSVFDDTRRFRARCLDLLEFYASRVRPTAPGSGAGSARSLGVPGAVSRSLEASVREAAVRSPHAAAMNAETLWTASNLEPRLLAVSILELQPPSAVPAWVESWAVTAGDDALLKRLAEGPLRGLHASDRPSFWGAVERFLDSRSAPLATTALLSVGSLVGELPDEEIPAVFEAFARSRLPEAGEAWRAALAILRGLSARSPAETAQYLIDEMDHGKPVAARLARQAMETFPPPQRQALRQALRLAAPA